MIEYDEEWLILLLWQYRGSLFPRAFLFAAPASVFAALLVQARESLPEFDEDINRELGIADAHRSQLWTAAIGILSALMLFRVYKAMERFWEGTGLLHQMRGEWFDAVSCCVTFSRGSLAKRPQETLNFRHAVVRLMSLCHGSALKEIGGATADEPYTIDPHGLDDDTLLHLKDCVQAHGFKRVEVLLHMIQSLVHYNLDQGILKIPPPILSRVYQTLSRGFVNLLNAKKIADTRFPFPFAQLISFFIFLNLILTPILVSSLFTKAWLAALFTFLPIFGICCMNFICAELEDPFGDDANDLPLDKFQEEMNQCLLLLLHKTADLMPSIEKKRCLMDVNEIRDAINGSSAIPLSRMAELSSGSSNAKVGRVRQKRLSAFREIIGEEPDEDAAEGSGEEIRDASEEILSFADEKAFDGKASPEGEKLQPETLLQGMEEIAMVLSEIKEAVAVQSANVSRSVDEFVSLAMDADFLERKPKR